MQNIMLVVVVVLAGRTSRLLDIARSLACDNKPWNYAGQHARCRRRVGRASRPLDIVVYLEGEGSSTNRVCRQRHLIEIAVC